MQQYFDYTVVLRRDKDNISMVTFLEAPGCDRQKKPSVMKWIFDQDTRDLVDEIAGIKSINSLVVLYLEVPYKAVKDACAIYLMFYHF